MIKEHALKGTEGVCSICECEPNYMTQDCSGRVLTAYEKSRVGRGRLDYRDCGWVDKYPRPRFVGTIEEVTAFLLAEC